MRIQPIGDRILLKPIEKENISETGIYIPESVNEERPYMYEVLGIGEGLPNEQPITIKVGDKVLSGQYSGDDIILNGEKYKIVPMKFILAIVK